MLCPKCGTQASDTAKFCPKCGNTLNSSVPQSDPTNNEHTVFAATPMGGIPQNPSAPQAPQPAPNVHPQYSDVVSEYPSMASITAQPIQKSGKRTGLIIAIILIVVLAIAGGVIALFATGVIGGNGSNAEIEAMLEEADDYLKDKKYDKAIKAYEDVLDEDDTNAEAYLGIAKAYEKQDELDEAIEILEDALKNVEDDDDLEDIEKKLEKLEEKAEGSSASDSTGESGYYGDTSYPDYYETGESDYYEGSNEGKVLNIWCWNDEFQQRITEFYPGYYDNGDGTGRIGDVTVKWTINPNADNGYQIPLDAALADQDNKSADEKIDIFLIEADYADKYVNSDYSLPVSDLGITDYDTSEMYPYTKQIATDNYGQLKAVSWQSAPGVFAYRRSIAREVLGSDDPEYVQYYVNNWDNFDMVASWMRDSGYYMLSGYDDAYRVFSNNTSVPWVNSYNEIVIDDNLWRWVDQTNYYTYYDYNNDTSLWSWDWSEDQGPDGKVFGFFFSTWGVDFTLLGNAGDAGYGDWAVCYGPDPYYWGGTWLCAGYQTDNPTLVHDIMYNMTCNGEIMEQITRDTQDYTNNMAAMERIANDYSFSNGFLGGQNPYGIFHENAMNIDMSNITPYDQGLNEEFQYAFRDYFTGRITLDEALDNFYWYATIKYPGLSVPY